MELKDQLLALVQERLSVKQIAIRLNLPKKYVFKAFQTYKLPTPLAYARSFLTKEYLEKRTSAGATLHEIAAATKVSISTVKSMLQKYDLKTTLQIHREEILKLQASELSPLKKGVVIGTLLGDAWIMKYSDFHYVLGIQQCEAQKEYAIFKAKTLLNTLFLQDYYAIPYNSEIDKWPRSTGYRFLSIHHSYLKFAYEMMHITGKKEVTPEILNDLTLLGIALWFGDDGSANLKDRSYYFSTNSFSKESLHLLREHLFKKCNVKTTLIKASGFDKKEAYQLRVASSSVEQFEKIIGPYICILPSVNYKYKGFYIKNPQRLYVKDILANQDIMI
jgi:hypothetical protein